MVHIFYTILLLNKYEYELDNCWPKKSRTGCPLCETYQRVRLWQVVVLLFAVALYNMLNYKIDRLDQTRNQLLPLNYT